MVKKAFNPWKGAPVMNLKSSSAIKTESTSEGYVVQDMTLDCQARNNARPSDRPCFQSKAVLTKGLTKGTVASVSFQ